ncbi:non-ribosomal peptide synthetase [Parvularcula sp. IMCC14364]|uniref:non-ribosomal peptide synthetase n=1 Tax=Parvularcula sp. IMCC14364 TaxID=3067902 RepID=UPI00274138C2|nr:non-ribosomal peptide synthetase [Parvularcula sp. IMCC14364]
MTQSQSARANDILAQLTELTANLSGYDEADLGASQTFLELGFDSLFLTQLATAFQKQYNVKITFRQLFDELPTLAAISAHIDTQLPADTAPAEKAAEPQPVQAAAPAQMPHEAPQMLPAAPAATVAPTLLVTPLAGAGNAGGLSGIFSEQINLMTQQLQMLQAARSGKPATQPVVAQQAAAASVAPIQTPQTGVPAEETATEAEPEKPQLPKGFGPTQNSVLSANALSAEQKAHIARLVGRYNAKTQVSKKRTQADRAYHADPRTAAGFNPIWKEMVYPIVVERSKGAYLWDADGNQYIDMLNGFGPNFFGHNAPFITEALKAQLDDSYEVGPQTPRAGEAAKLLCELTGMDRVSWVNTGSEAVQAAIRISRTMTGRDKIVVFSGDYHGNFDEVLVRGTKNARGRRTIPLAPGIPFDSVGNVIVLDYGDMASLEEIKAQADDIAAVLVEPIQSRRPELQPKEFLHALRDLTREEEIVLVFDEVITGFRTGPGGAQAYFGIEADMATYGKIIGGGMPIGVVAGRSRFMDTFDGGQWSYGDDSRPTAGVTFFAGTFVRHPLAIAAAHASLSYIKTAGPALQQGVNKKATRLATTLTAFFAEQGVNFEVPHFASQMFIRNNEENELATLFFYHMRDRGIHLLEGFPTYMTAAYTDEDVDQVIAAAKDSIFEMQADGILATPHGKSVVYNRKFDLTDAQRHTWLACQMGEEASCAFNESDTVLIKGKLDEQKFSEAVEHGLASHEAFRVRFDPDGEYQWVDHALTLCVESHDFGDLSGEALAEKTEAFFAAQGCQAFDLENGPLVRAHLIRTGAESWIFTIYCHHLVFDGYSAQLVIDDIVQRYNQAVSGHERERTEFVPFSVYAQAIAPQSGNEAQARSRVFWQEVFSDKVPALIDLPTDKSRQAERQYAGSTYHHELKTDLTEKLQGTARKLGVSQNAVLFSAFAALLSRLSAQDDFVIAMPAAGQARHELETVGYCVNMLPVRLQPAYDASFADFARQTQKSVLDAFDHQEFTFSELLQDINAPRHTGRLSLTETVFNYSRYFSDIDMTGCEVSARENRRQSVYYDLFFNIVEADGRLHVDFDFATSLYREETIARWVTHFETLLEDALVYPERAIGELTLDTEGQAGFSLTGPTTSHDMDKNVVSLFATAAAASPDSVAIICDGKATTYGQLQAYASQLTNYLAEQNVGAGDIVGIMLNRSVDMVASILAIWSRGAAYLPLDPEFPVERLNYMVEDAGACRVISSADLATLSGQLKAPVLDLTREITAIAGQATAVKQEIQLKPEDRAYVIYTSGSTGKPKGVENTHGALLNFVESMKVSPGLVSTDRLLAVTTLSFDISLLELMVPLSAGAQIIMATQDEVLDGYDLCDLITDNEVTIMQATPATWRLMLDCEWDGTQTLKALCGGEPLPSALAEQLLPRTVELWNMYGPTETTVWSTCVKISDHTDITVGTPIDNTVLYVLDDYLRPVPKGVPGELWIGGAGVARGYIGRPELTAERFRADPFVDDVAARIYCTGDRAILLPDGRVEMRGRRDNQVKVRGHRIELGEVEEVLACHYALDAVAIAVRDDHHGEPMLAAYIVPGNRERVTHSDLRQWLRQSVPDYMVPQVFVEIAKLPLTGNNKLDRNALPEAVSLRLVETDRVLPRTEREREIAALWQEMLEITDISVTDNFFELGGQSLQVAKMSALLRKMHGYRISPRAVIFETLEQLAASVDREAS